jgi:putative oxidoreductase
MFVENVLQIWSPRALAIMRIVTGLLFMQHGSMKVLRFPYDAMQAATPIASLGCRRSARAGRGMLDCPGTTHASSGVPALRRNGRRLFHSARPEGACPVPSLNEGELAVLYCFIFLYLVFAGAGAGSTVRQRAVSTRP